MTMLDIPHRKATPAEIKLRVSGGFWDFNAVNPARSFLCLSLGTLLGLGIAGFGLFTAKGTITRNVPPENIALVNQRPILRTDFIAQTEALYTVPFGDTTLPQRLKVLRDMIREELFVQRGLELDFPGTDSDTRAALVAAVEQQVVADVTAARPSDADLRKFFDDNSAKYASEGLMTLHDLMLPKPNAGEPDAIAKLRKAVEALRVGTSLEEVKTVYGLQEVGGGRDRPGGEEFYFAQKIHIGDTIFALAHLLNDGEVSGPVAAEDGIHIVLMIKNVKPKPRPFEAARNDVINDFNEAARKRLQDADERYLRGKAEILIADDYAQIYEKGEPDRSVETGKPVPAMGRGKR